MKVLDRVLAGLFAAAVCFAVAAAVADWPRTEYAPGYSESAFRSLGRGADADTVRRALGEPLGIRKDEDGLERVLWYCRPAAGSENHRVRAVVLDRTGRLDGKLARTHWDRGAGATAEWRRRAPR